MNKISCTDCALAINGSCSVAFQANEASKNIDNLPEIRSEIKNNVQYSIRKIYADIKSYEKEFNEPYSKVKSFDVYQKILDTALCIDK